MSIQLSWSELSALQRDVLVEIWRHQQSDEIAHGASIRRTLSNRRDRPLDTKSLYRVINTLTERGLITKQYADGRRKQLELTNQASQLLEKQAEKLAIVAHP